MNKPRGIFVTGTDTGVGKTVVAGALLKGLKSAGVDAVYMKPVQTGCLRKSGKTNAPDLEFVTSFSGIFPSEKERECMSPCRYRAACSPHLASKLERRPIKLSRIIGSFKALQHAHDFVIVEGAGGILTPLTRQYSILNLMKALALPVIVVARPGLGTINHTLLTLRELRQTKLDILGIVINYAEDTLKTVIEKDNLKTITRLGNTRIIAELPFMRKLQTSETGQAEPAAAGDSLRIRGRIICKRLFGRLPALSTLGGLPELGQGSASGGKFLYIKLDRLKPKQQRLRRQR